MISLCSDWEFTREWSAGFSYGEGRYARVSLPHTAGEVPLHYAKPEDYAGICGYRRLVSVPLEYRGKRLFLQFDGAAHLAEVYLNGEKIAEHACGYTAFRVEITSFVRYGMENLLAVRLDTTENPAVPPFGFVLDARQDLREQGQVEPGHDDPQGVPPSLPQRFCHDIGSVAQLLSGSHDAGFGLRVDIRGIV